MKVLDYALVFVIIVLPIILAVNINISSKIKAQNLESYYKNLIDSAISDASKAMKEVENADSEVDYGYSGEGEKKVSVNAEHAVNIFFDSLFYNLDIKGNKQAEDTLKMYVPAMAVIDYNGVHIYSVEKYRDSTGRSYIDHIMKPKKYFTYSYNIEMKFDDKTGRTRYMIVPGSDHTVNFTLNNFITHIDKDGNTFKRFMEDIEMQDVLFDNAPEDETNTVRSNLISQLKERQKEVIVQTVANEIATAINRHNKYAEERGVRYSFTFPTMSEDEWFSTVQDVGILAFVQGISVGNKYLNHYSYGLSKLSYNQRYYPSTNAKGKEFFGKGNVMTENNLYHKDKNCSLYTRTTPVNDPLFFKTKKEAATCGYTPCPVCFYDMIDYYFPGGLDHGQALTQDLVDKLPGGKEILKGEKRVFDYTGHQVMYTLYPGTYRIEVLGAQGGNHVFSEKNGKVGGLGGRVEAKLTLTEKTDIFVTVGGQGQTGTQFNLMNEGSREYLDAKFNRGGYNGGGNSAGGGPGGGGATDIRIGGKEIKHRVIVAGGGGGNGYFSMASPEYDKTNGGAPSPRNSDDASVIKTIHRKNSIGNSVQGMGEGEDINLVNEAIPVEFYGESGCINRHQPTKPNDEAGGGGGYYGGAVYHSDNSAYGFGGTSYVNNSIFTDAQMKKGVNSGHGKVIITREN